MSDLGGQATSAKSRVKRWRNSRRKGRKKALKAIDDFIQDDLRLSHLLLTVGVVAVVGLAGSFVGRWWSPLPAESFGTVGQWVGGVAAAAAILALGIERRVQEARASHEDLSELEAALHQWVDPAGTETKEARQVVSAALGKCYPELRPFSRWMLEYERRADRWNGRWLFGARPWHAIRDEFFELLDPASDTAALKERLELFMKGYPKWVHTDQRIKWVCGQRYRPPTRPARKLNQVTPHRTAKTTVDGLVRRLDALRRQDPVPTEEIDATETELVTVQQALDEIIERENEAWQQTTAEHEAKNLPAKKSQALAALEDESWTWLQVGGGPNRATRGLLPLDEQRRAARTAIKQSANATEFNQALADFHTNCFKDDPCAAAVA